jgi:oxygen-independent coproporphyrinogen-3 oxidase
MSTENTRNSSPYKKALHWPPYTYRDYPRVTPEALQAFKDFLENENTNNLRKELQPWIPFCTSKCNFCYFPTELTSNNEIGKYLDALKKVLKMYAETKYARTSEFSEIYLAGGTPSIMSIEQTIDLLLFCEKKFNITDNREIKITGCTNDFDYKKLRALREYGVDQLDLGIQTFDDEYRSMLNLRDKAKDAKDIVKRAHQIGLRVSIDLLYNLPGQSAEDWSRDIQRAIELDIESADCYALEVYPETKLAQQLQSGELPPIRDREVETEMYLEADKFFKMAGYEPTCHNRFSRIKEDFQEPCMEVLGTGAGFFMGTLGKFSYMDIEPAESYIEAVRCGEFPISRLSVNSSHDEMGKMMMRLLIRLPVNRYEFKNRFGRFPEAVFASPINKLEEKGLIEIDDQEIRLTKLGDIWRINVCWEFSQPQVGIS